MADAQRNSVQSQLVAKAWKDEGFREELKRDPKAVLEREMGVRLPEHVNVQVHEETADTIHVVLPAHPNQAAQMQLSDEELEAVAGGGITASGASSCETTCDTKAANCVTGSSLCVSRQILLYS